MERMIKEIKEQDNLEDMIRIVGKYYDTSTKLGSLKRIMVANQIPNLIRMLQLRKK